MANKQRKKSFRESAAAKSRKAAKAFASKLQVELAEGNYFGERKGKRLFGTVARDWLDGANPDKRDSGWVRDEIVIRVHLEPIERHPINQVRPSYFRALVAYSTESLAPATVHRNYGVLRAIRNWAVAEDIIRRSPCRGKLPSKNRSGSGRALTSEQLKRLADAMDIEHETLMWVMVLLGLRWGEAAALRVGSIHFGDEPELEVTETIQRGVGGRRFVGPPKSDAGRRRLTSPTSLAKLLEAQLDHRGLDVGNPADEQELLFVNDDGEMLDATNWRRRVWWRAAIDAGLGQMVEAEDGKQRFEGITPDDLRRATATALVAGDVDIKTARARLGHSDVRMTLDFYAKVKAERDREAADIVADSLMPDSDG